jgi:RNA polymerase sigma-70 factor (ECF subfamily)
MSDSNSINIELISSLKQGKEEAYEHIFKMYYASLCRYACPFLKDMGKAEELVQECFIQMWEMRDRVNINSSVKFYLFRVVKNRCLNYLKKEQRKNRIVISLEEEIDNREIFYLESVSDPDRHIQLEGRTSSAMNLLPTACREIFEMAKISGMTYKEISNELGISVKTVENQMSKALRILRKELSGVLSLILCFFRK